MEMVPILTTVLTTITAFFAAYVTWQQYQLSQRQFRRELYERRLEVFAAVRSYLSDIARDGKVGFHRCALFYAGTAEAEFLFGDEVIELIQEIYKRGLKLARLHEQLYPESGEPGLPVGEERSRVAEDESKVLAILIGHLPNIKTVFKPYLTMQ